MWNENEKVLEFVNYFAFKEKNSIGKEIGDVIIQNQSQLLQELIVDIVNSGGTNQELLKYKSFVFMDSWNDMVILEVLAESVLFVDG